MSERKWGMTYIIVLILSLLVIFFIGKEVNPQTGTTKMILTPNGITHFRKGMDVAGWVRLHYKIDLSKYKELYPNPQEYATVTRDVQDIILQNIDTRVSKLGVSDYSTYIQTLNDEQFVIVELWGVHDLNQAKQTIGKTVELEFKTAYQGDGSDVRDVRQLQAEDLLKKSVADPILMQSFVANKESESMYFTRHENVPLEALPQVYQDNPELLTDRQPGSVYPTLIEGVYTVVPPVQGITDQDTTLRGRVISRFVSAQQVAAGTGESASGSVAAVAASMTYTVEELFVDAAPQRITAKDPVTNEVLNGAFFKYANVSQSQTGLPVALINFDDKGTTIFCNITSEIVGQQLAIFVGGQLVTAPVIREKICAGSAQIDGQFDGAGAKQLVTELNEGALPAPLILANEEKVSASLGEQALQWALRAGLSGLIAVYTYMILIYGRKKGTIALVTLLSFLTVLFAVVKLLGSALSLSGIAAILLSIGMGVDANILIYERTKEEAAAGKPITQAILDGYERSRSAIKDGNMTTVMIAVLLFFMGTNVFKGFGAMMIVNTLITLMVLVPFTKYCLLWVYGGKK